MQLSLTRGGPIESLTNAKKIEIVMSQIKIGWNKNAKHKAINICRFASRIGHPLENTKKYQALASSQIHIRKQPSNGFCLFGTFQMKVINLMAFLPFPLLPSLRWLRRNRAKCNK